MAATKAVHLVVQTAAVMVATRVGGWWLDGCCELGCLEGCDNGCVG
jgi:hypothetical protein